MVQYQDAALDRVFAALADGTRRGVLDALAAGGARSVSELAEPYPISLPAFLKHLRTLEQAGLIARDKDGRVVSCELSAAPMKQAADWIARYQRFWTERLDALGRYLHQHEEPPRWHRPESRNVPRSRSGASTRSHPRRSGGHGPTRRR